MITSSETPTEVKTGFGLELAPRNADGTPAGRKDANKRIKPPTGVSANEWAQVIELAAQHFTMTAGMVPISKERLQSLDVGDSIKNATWNKLFVNENYVTFMSALAVRGVLPIGKGLTPMQSMAIDLITNFSDHSRLTTKLSMLGVTASQWNRWQEHAVFAEQLQLAAERARRKAEPLVTMTLTQMAVHDKNLSAIQYFDKVAGRDPEQKNGLNSRTVVQIVIDVLCKHLADDPDKLRAIAAEMEVKMNMTNPS